MIWISSQLKAIKHYPSQTNVLWSSLFKFLIVFWQFSCYYGDYVSQSLDQRL